MMRASFPLAAALALGAVPSAPLAQHMSCGQHDHAQAAGDGRAGHGGHGARTGDAHEIVVTSEGFTPSSIRVKRGVPVKLVVTRKTDRTCAKEIVIEGYGIEKALPLGEPVAIELTPRKSGEIRYACGMKMVTGVLLVE